MGVLKRFKETSAFGLLLVGLGMAWMSWRKWSEPYVDYGFQLYVPWQLNEGKVLYRDIFFLYGPLSQHLNALLFKVFGTHMLTLALFNHLLVALQAWLVYKVFREIFDAAAGTACAALFLAVFAFSQYNQNGNGNYITPYSHEAVHSSVMAWAALWCFLRFLRDRSQNALLAAAALTGAVFMTKVEVSLAVFAALASGAGCLLFLERPPARRSLRLLAACSACFLAVPAAFFLLYCRWMPPLQALGSVLQHLAAPLRPNLASHPVFRWLMGTDDLKGSLTVILYVTFAHSILLAATALSCWAVHRFGGESRRESAVRAFWIAAVPATLYLFFGLYWINFFRPLTLYMPAFCAWLAWEVWSRRAGDPVRSRRAVGRLAVAVFACLMTLKIAFKIEVFFYGFVLAMPAVLFWMGATVHGLPRLLGRFFGDCGYLKPVLLLFAVVCGAWHIYACREIYRYKTFPLGRGSDMLYDFTPRLDFREKMMEKTLKKLEELKQPGQTLVVFPAGIILNYWTRMASPTHLYHYSYSYLQIAGEERTERQLLDNPPDWIVLYDAEASLGEPGFHRFGVDYEQKTMAWIQSRYTPVYQAAPPDRSTFGMVIFQRRPAS